MSRQKREKLPQQSRPHYSTRSVKASWSTTSSVRSTSNRVVWREKQTKKETASQGLVSWRKRLIPQALDNCNYFLTAMAEGIVTLDFADLASGADLRDQIRTAFGVEGLGILTVKNVPGFVESRGRCEWALPTLPPPTLPPSIVGARAV